MPLRVVSVRVVRVVLGRARHFLVLAKPGSRKLPSAMPKKISVARVFIYLWVHRYLWCRNAVLHAVNLKCVARSSAHKQRVD